MEQTQLNTTLKILGVASDNQTEVEIIQLLFEMVESAICVYIGETVVPDNLKWITNEVVIQRYQLIGAEHLEAEGIDVLSSTYRSPSELLENYFLFLDSYNNTKDSNKASSKRLGYYEIQPKNGFVLRGS